MGLLAYDVRQGLVGLLRSPRYSIILVGVITLTLASVAILMVQIYSVAFTKLPPEKEAKVVRVYSDNKMGGWLEIYEVDHFAGAQNSISPLVPFGNRQVTVQNEGHLLSVSAGSVRSEFFDIFGVAPLEGRAMNWEDDQEGAARVALISHRLWQTGFQSNPEIIGSPMIVDDHPTVIIGVMPEGFHYPTDQDLWLSSFSHASVPGAGESVIGIGLLHGSEQLGSRTLTDLKRRLSERYPTVYQSSIIHVERLVSSYVKGDLRVSVAFMVSVSLAVLLIGSLCALNLMASRFFSRTKEWRLRAVLGAGAPSVAVNLLVESVVLFTVGALLAFLTFGIVIYWIADYLVIHNQSTTPFWWNADLSLPVVVFLLSAVGFMIAVTTIWFLLHFNKIFRRTESDVASTLSRSMLFTRWVYAFLQISLTTFLLGFFVLVGASYYATINRDLGFDTSNLLVANLMSESGNIEFIQLQELAGALEQVPGIERIAFSDSMPGMDSFTVRRYQNLHSNAGHSHTETLLQVGVSPGFFDVLDIDLVQGELFSPADYDSVSPTALAVTDVKTSQKLSGGETMLGDSLALRSNAADGEGADEVVRIIGLVRSVEYGSGAINDIIYTPLPGYLTPFGWLMQAKTEGNPLGYVEPIQSVLTEHNVALRIENARTAQQLLAEGGRASRSMMLNFLPAVILAIVMCVVGVLDVAKSISNGSRREIGICKALGMRDRSIVLRYARYGILCVVLGVATGAATFLLANPLVFERLVGGFEYRTLALVLTVSVTAVLGVVAMLLPLINVIRQQSISGLIR